MGASVQIMLCMQTTNLNQLFEKIRTNNEYAALIEKGRQMYESKPFFVQNKQAYKVSLVGRYVFGGVSIVSGVASCLAFSLSPYIVIPIAVLLLCFVEVLKNITVNDVCRVYLTQRRVSPALAIALLLFSASAFLSVKGSIHAGKLLGEGQRVQLESTHTAKVDSTIAYYDAIIAGEKASLSEFKNSVSWRGKINMANKATQKEIGRLNESIQAIEAQKALALSDLRSAGKTDSSIQKATAESNTLLLAGICAGIELSILSMIAFGAFYLYRAYSDPELLEEETAYNLHAGELGKLVELARLARPASPYASLQATLKDNASNTVEKPSIGFKAPSKHIATLAEMQAHARDTKYSDYYEKYPELVQELQAVNAGQVKKTIKELAKNHAVHEATIYRIKKAIFV